MPKADFGDPLTATAYRFCVYDGTSSLVLGLSAPAGGICNAKTNRPCWRDRRHGFSYRQRDAAVSALQKLDLREGTIDGTARVGVGGRGALLVPPNPETLVMPVTVQIQASNGLCVESRFSDPVSRRSRKLFTDHAD